MDRSIDRTDEKILQLLQGNARMSFEELGRQIGMSRVAAKKRVKKLEEAGIVRGYNTCISRPGEVQAFIDVEATTVKFEEILRYVSTRTEYIRQIFCLFKRNHILLVAVTPTPEELRYLANVVAKQDGIVKVTCDVVSEVIKDVYGGVRRYESEWEPQRGDEYLVFKGNADGAGSNEPDGSMESGEI